VYDVGIHGYVSPMGHDSAGAWPDWQYNRDGVSIRPYEDLSAFAVASYRATASIRLHAGIGRGRFVGYGDRSKYLNTDILTHGHHQWAVGLFGGAEVFVIPQVAVVAEASGRDVNAGLRASFSAITATIAWTKMEGLLLSEGGEPCGRLEASLSYRFNDWAGLGGLFRPRGPRLELTEPVCPPRELVPTPRGVTVCPNTSSLEPIWFDWDSWEITPEATEVLARDAGTLLGHPNTKVVVLGYASEEGSPEANCMLSGKRALAVFECLKSLGVPGQQMRYQSAALSFGEPCPVRREVCFETESGD
jgi:hypothetical protein